MSSNKDEPLKVMDLETVDETAPLPPQSTNKDPANTKGRSVFDRLTYGGPTRGPRKTSDDQSSESGVGGGKGVGSGRAKGRPMPTKTTKPTRPSAGTTAPAAANNAPAPSASNATDAVTTPSSGSGSVFDRLTSGEKLYRNSSQTKKPGAKRVDPDPAVSANKQASSAGKRVAESAQQSMDSPAIVLPTNEMSNGLLIGSPDREELVIDDDDDEDPVINVSLVQPPTKVTSAKKKKSPEPIVKKRESWKIARIPLSLVERTSLARGALPVLPRPLAWTCLLLNGLLPGTGTMLSGMLAMCFGAPRFSVHVTTEHRLLALVINLFVGLFQTVSVLFCLVGWCWALGWGILLVKVAGYYVKWKKSNANNPDEDRRMMMNVPISITADEERY